MRDRDAKRRAASVVVALHGFSGTGADWRLARRHANARYHWICPDLYEFLSEPGGTDPKDRARRWDDYSEELALRIKPQVASQPWVLLGYSMGARVALQLVRRIASLWVEPPSSMVLVSPHPGIEDALERENRFEADAAFANETELKGLEWFRSRWSQHPLIAPQMEISAADRALVDGGRMGLGASEIAASLRALSLGTIAPIWDWWGTLGIPTLVVTGARDPKYCELARVMQAASTEVKHLTIDGVGHAPHIEAPEAFARALETFIESPG